MGAVFYHEGTTRRFDAQAQPLQPSARRHRVPNPDFRGMPRASPRGMHSVHALVAATLVVLVSCGTDTTTPSPAGDAATEAGSCAPLANFSGPWHSVYSCTSSAAPTDSGEFDLTITQSGDAASYTDSGTTFSGKVCKNVWTFSSSKQLDGGGVETESGTLTLLTPTTAERKSTWQGPGAHGDCTDQLTRK
jgi:hypothetical protein